MNTEIAIRPKTGATVNTSSGPVDTSSILGWGVDANPQNDPTYPYRDRSADDHSGEWVRPAQQRTAIELLQSVEHKQTPAVFGTASPPRGVSGAMRRLAFRWSESHWAHWLILMGADRVDMVEGVVTDLAAAKVPNIPAEMGIRAEWQHNKQGLATKIGIAALIGAALYAWSKSDKEDDDYDYDEDDDAEVDELDAEPELVVVNVREEETLDAP